MYILMANLMLAVLYMLGFVLYFRRKNVSIPQVLFGIAAGTAAGVAINLIIVTLDKGWATFSWFHLHAIAAATFAAIVCAGAIPRLSRYRVASWVVFVVVTTCVWPLCLIALITRFGLETDDMMMGIALSMGTGVAAWTFAITAYPVLMTLWLRRYAPSTRDIVAGVCLGVVLFAVLEFLVRLTFGHPYHINYLRHVAMLFATLSPSLWLACDHSGRKAFVRVWRNATTKKCSNESFLALEVHRKPFESGKPALSELSRTCYTRHMPVSTTVHISHCLNWIIQLDPHSILDVGCGFGTWGFLCREHLDVAKERVHPHEWQVRIDGLELFEPYIQTHQRALYSSITIGDIRALAPRIEPYELIIAGDVIEHLDKEEGEEVLRVLYEKATKALLVNIPLEGNWDHPERHGNPGELHRSQWSVNDFLPFPSACEIFTLPCGTYGSFFCPKDCTLDQRIEGLIAAAEHAERINRISIARRHLETAQALAPHDERVAMFLAEILILTGDRNAAIDALEHTLRLNPNFHYAHLALARLLMASHQPSRAQVHLDSLIHTPGVSEDLRAKALQLRSS